MLSQAPPTSEYFPSPILDKMTAAESSGPTANGVCLKARNKEYFNKMIHIHGLDQNTSPPFNAKLPDKK